MKTLVLRDKRGFMKAKFDGGLSVELLTSIEGHWREYKFKGAATVCYECDSDCKFKLYGRGGSMEIFIWEGDILIEE